MLRRAILTAMLIVLLPASAVDAFLHLHDNPEHNHHVAATAGEGFLHTHLQSAARDHTETMLAADASEQHDKLRFANLFRSIAAASVMPVICLETVEYVPDRNHSAPRVVDLIPSAHDPPSVDCSIPRSPPA